MQQIPLKNRDGEIVGHTSVDDSDYEWALSLKWSRSSNGYVRCGVYNKAKGQTQSRYMHRMVFERANGPLDKAFVDHINRDPLDNRRSNLRSATPLESVANRSHYRRNKLGYTGVKLCPDTGKYVAYMNHAGKNLCFGYYEDLLMAAIVRDLHAKEILPVDYVKLNIPDATPEQVALADHLRKTYKRNTNYVIKSKQV